MEETLTFPPTDPEAITVTDTLIKGSVLMRRVHVYSCEHELTDGDDLYGYAREAVKREAANIGATGIFRLTYGRTGILDGGCLIGKGVHATGIAFRRG
ncbi:MAG: hypothetical protein WDZ83_08845 [Rhizobiaceae bacterium]